MLEDVPMTTKAPQADKALPLIVNKCYMWKNAKCKVLNRIKPGSYPAEAIATLEALERSLPLYNKLASRPGAPGWSACPEHLQLFTTLVEERKRMPEIFNSKDPGLFFVTADSPDPVLLQKVANATPNLAASFASRGELGTFILGQALKEAKFYAFVGPGGVDMTAGNYTTGTYPCTATYAWLLQAALERKQ